MPQRNIKRYACARYSNRNEKKDEIGWDCTSCEHHVPFLARKKTPKWYSITSIMNCFIFLRRIVLITLPTTMHTARNYINSTLYHSWNSTIRIILGTGRSVSAKKKCKVKHCRWRINMKYLLYVMHLAFHFFFLSRIFSLPIANTIHRMQDGGQHFLYPLNNLLKVIKKLNAIQSKNTTTLRVATSKCKTNFLNFKINQTKWKMKTLSTLASHYL